MLAEKERIAAMGKQPGEVARVATALRQARIPYAIVGGCAVAVWMASVDKTAVHDSDDVDLLVRRADLQRVREALETIGFSYRNAGGVDVFLPILEDSRRVAVHVLYAAERVDALCPIQAPDVTESAAGPDFQIATLDALVRLNLTAFRMKDKLQLRDLLKVGLVDAPWCDRLPDVLGARLRQVMDLL